MRTVPAHAASALLAVGVLVASHPARASEPDGPDTALALAVAAALDTAGFIVGGTLVGTSPANGAGDAQRSFGWLTVQLGYTASPFLAHGVVGEWGRGALFSAVPAAALGSTAAIYRTRTDSVEYSSLEDQRVVWSLFGAGLLASAVGAVDVLFAGSRRHPPAVALRPAFGPGQAGITCGGTL